MKQLFSKINMLRPLCHFFENPYAEIHMRELARRLDMNPSSLLKWLRFLEKENLVLRRKERNATYYKAFLERPEFRHLKIAHTVMKICGSEALDFIINLSVGLHSVLLYGSAARGEDGAESDYDFLVIAASCGATPTALEDTLGRSASLQVYSIDGWKRVAKSNRAFYLDVISDSVPLYGKKPVID